MRQRKETLIRGENWNRSEELPWVTEMVGEEEWVGRDGEICLIFNANLISTLITEFNRYLNLPLTVAKKQEVKS